MVEKIFHEVKAFINLIKDIDFQLINYINNFEKKIRNLYVIKKKIGEIFPLEEELFKINKQKKFQSKEFKEAKDNIINKIEEIQKILDNKLNLIEKESGSAQVNIEMIEDEDREIQNWIQIKIKEYSLILDKIRKLSNISKTEKEKLEKNLYSMLNEIKQNINLEKEELRINQELEELILNLNKQVIRLKHLLKELIEELNELKTRIGYFKLRENPKAIKNLTKEIKLKIKIIEHELRTERVQIMDNFDSFFRRKKKVHRIITKNQKKEKISLRVIKKDIYSLNTTHEVAEYLNLLESRENMHLINDIKEIDGKDYFLINKKIKRFIDLVKHKNNKKSKKNEDILKKLAYVDQLTNLKNRRAYDENLKNLITKGKIFSLAIADIDFFKSFNDTYGHKKGDEVLSFVANIFESFSNEIKVYRYGGEEIAILCSGINKKQASKILNKLRKRLELESNEIMSAINDEFGLIKEGFRTEITVSIGISEFPSDANNAKKLFNSADDALYKAKEKGRNQVISF